MSFKARAPSNIALIKYMGKTSPTENKPSNASLSWSLNHLESEVVILPSDRDEDYWSPLQGQKMRAPDLSENGQKRFLNHFYKLKNHWGVVGSFEVKSANNFPADCGIASSASSFAALTKATYYLAQSQINSLDETVTSLSKLSRQGSGSSCRSLFSAWSIWEQDGARAMEFPYKDLAHTLVLVESSQKKVSSSEAHLRVTSSPNFLHRVERAQSRLSELQKCLESQDWASCFRIVKDESDDMHNLFETSEPSFSYRTSKSHLVAQLVEKFWVEQNDGPLFTMDAGANVHLLWRPDQLLLAKDLQNVLGENIQGIELVNSPHFIEGDM